MDLNQFIAVKKEVVEKLDLNERNVSEINMKSARYYTYYLDMYCEELDEYKKCKLGLDEVAGGLYKKYKETYNRELTKGEIEAYIKQEKTYCGAKRKVDFQEIVTLYLENVLKEINNMNFKIKNLIELKKFYAGG